MLEERASQQFPILEEGQTNVVIPSFDASGNIVEGEFVAFPLFAREAYTDEP